MKFYTLKRNVKLLPGQIIGFVKGSGYYARTPSKPAPKPKPEPIKFGLLTLAEARTHLGVHESPSGSNRTKFGAWFGVDGVAWCNIFISYCVYRASGGKVILCKGYVAPGVYQAKGCTYVPSTEAWAKSVGRWHSTPAPGRLAIYNWDGGVPDHIGIVESVGSGGNFVAVEGNTAYGNDSNGGEVMRRNRNVSNCDGFVELDGLL